MRRAEAKTLLEERYGNADPELFIREDPLSIPHRYERKEDIEIMAFLTATISWGQRSTIIRNARSMEKGMDHEPFGFVWNASSKEIRVFRYFQHRTFNGTDLRHFLSALQMIYRDHGGMHRLFGEGVSPEDDNLRGGIQRFRDVFFSIPHHSRTEKHVADPSKGSPSKRLHMFLRWMVRNDAIDLGIWKDLGVHRLSCPLDLHTAKVARRLGLIRRKQNDGKTVVELDQVLRRFDPEDPVKYDIALHRMGVEEGVAKEARKQV